MNQICDFKRSSDSKEQEIFAIPDFVGLIYPVISMKDDVTHPGSRKQLLGDNSTSENIIQYSADLNVTSCFPPVFLLHCCDDDLVSIENSLLMYRGLIEKGVSAEMHLYEKGGHGFSVQWATDLPVGGWIKLFMDWMYSHGFK
nr:prolyl oligopeptidase family serine peptidase [Escherichia coli]